MNTRPPVLTTDDFNAQERAEIEALNDMFAHAMASKRLVNRLHVEDRDSFLGQFNATASMLQNRKGCIEASASRRRAFKKAGLVT